MLIDDLHRVVFVHIPKCAGSSVIRQLSELDSRKAFRRPIDHPELGRIAGSHIPLPYLKRYFPETFEQVRTYASFAVVREPSARFGSAIFQRLREAKAYAPAEITAELALAEARTVVDWLSQREGFCDRDYIHFSRQIDFVAVDGARVVQHLFPIEDMAGFGAAIGARCGVAFDASLRENVNHSTSNELVRSLRLTLKPIYSRVTPWALRRKVLSLMEKRKLGGPSEIYAALRAAPAVQSFIRDYYSDDFTLYQACRAA